MKKYKVEHDLDGIYQVFQVDEYNNTDYTEHLFRGTLPECESWIRLTEEGYMN